MQWPALTVQNLYLSAINHDDIEANKVKIILCTLISAQAPKLDAIKFYNDINNLFILEKKSNNQASMNPTAMRSLRKMKSGN